VELAAAPLPRTGVELPARERLSARGDKFLLRFCTRLSTAATAAAAEQAAASIPTAGPTVVAVGGVELLARGFRVLLPLSGVPLLRAELLSLGNRTLLLAEAAPSTEPTFAAAAYAAATSPVPRVLLFPRTLLPRVALLPLAALLPRVALLARVALSARCLEFLRTLVAP
jgi:hypothetical protein